MKLLDELEALAKKATQGEWVSDDVDGICAQSDTLNDGVYIAFTHGPHFDFNRDFITAANPATILAIAEHVRELEQRAEAAEAELARIKAAVPAPQPVYQLEDADGWQDYSEEDFNSLVISQNIPECYRRVLYTAPLAPALRLPDEVLIHSEMDFVRKEKAKEFNRCINEVKRLNATAPQPVRVVTPGALPDDAKFESWWESENYDQKLRNVQGVMFNRVKNTAFKAWMASAKLTAGDTQ